MTQADICTWLEYWGASRSVTIDNIRSIQDVVQARKFCQVMRTGIFCEDLLSDLQIWRALCAMRKESSIA